MRQRINSFATHADAAFQQEEVLLSADRRVWRWPEPDLHQHCLGRRRPGGGIREEPWRTESDGHYSPARSLWPIPSSQYSIK